MSEVSHAPSTGIPPVKPGGKCGYQMQQIIETHLPHLTRPQLTGLVLWVCGAILAGSAGQNAVASALSPWGAWNNFRQYLREWLYDGSDRARPCKTQMNLTLCSSGCSPGSAPAGWQRPSVRLSRATRPLPSSSAWSTAVALFPWPGASTAPPSAAPGWTPPWNCSRNWPQPFPGLPSSSGSRYRQTTPSRHRHDTPPARPASHPAITTATPIPRKTVPPVHPKCPRKPLEDPRSPSKPQGRPGDHPGPETLC